MNRHGKVLIALLLLAATVVAVWLAPGQCSTAPLSDEPFRWSGQEHVTPEHVEQYIHDWLEVPCARLKGERHDRCVTSIGKQRRSRRAPELAALIDSVADARDVDPLVVAVVVAHESSFIEGDVRGGIGERGLMQVHGLALREAQRHGYDLATSEGQLAAGTDHLRRCEGLCDGSLLQTLGMYQSGSCKTSAYGPQLRTGRIRARRAQVASSFVAVLSGPISPRTYM